jgi:hypothetical protein
VIPGARFTIYGRKGARYLEPVKGMRNYAYVAKPGQMIDLGVIALKDE